jgi:hypothetical protein
MATVRGPVLRLEHRRGRYAGAALLVGLATTIAIVTLVSVDRARSSIDPGVAFERSHPALVAAEALGVVLAIAACWVVAAVRPWPAASLALAVAVALAGVVGRLALAAP